MIAIGRPVDSQTALIAVDLGGQERWVPHSANATTLALQKADRLAPDPAYPNSAALAGVSGRSSSNPSVTSSRKPCRNRVTRRAQRGQRRVRAGIPGHRPAGPLEQLGKHPTAQPSRPWVIALTVGTDHPPGDLGRDLLVVVIGE